jgi:DNA-directed RNA polymerase alpha subunit
MTDDQKALREEGIKTVGEVREKSDQQLLAFQNLGKGSVIHLRKTLGLPSTGRSNQLPPSAPNWRIFNEWFELSLFC